MCREGSIYVGMYVGMSMCMWDVYVNARSTEVQIQIEALGGGLYGSLMQMLGICTRGY